MLGECGKEPVVVRRKGLEQHHDELFTQVDYRINRSAVDKNFVMQVGSGSSAGHPHGANDLALTHFLPHHHIEGADVGLLGGDEPDHIKRQVDSVDLAVRPGEYEEEVVLSIHNLPLTTLSLSFLTLQKARPYTGPTTSEDYDPRLGLTIGEKASFGTGG